MTSKELVKKALEAWKFPVLEESDKGLMIRFQMNYVQVGSLSDDSVGVAVNLSGIFHADDDREMRLALLCANEINYKMMQVKCYLDDERDIVIASEFFYESEEDFAALLHVALETVVSGKRRFLHQYPTIEEEDAFMKQLEESGETSAEDIDEDASQES